MSIIPWIRNAMLMATIVCMGLATVSWAADTASFPATGSGQSSLGTVKHVKVQDLNIAYTEQGAGQPVVLLHGGRLTSAMWSKQVPALAEHYRVIVPDTRGHGGTDNPSHKFDYPLLAGDVVAFCTAIGVKKPVLMGYSDGGIIAMTVGVLHPDFARALVLGGVVPPVDQASLDHYFEGMQTFYAPITKRTVLTDADLDIMYQSAPEMWDFTAKMHAKSGKPDDWRTLIKDVWLTWNNPQAYAYTPDQIAAIDVPTLVILGDRDEFYLAAKAVSFAEGLPQGEVAVLPHAGHNVFRARPELFNPLVLDFLSRVTH